MPLEACRQQQQVSSPARSALISMHWGMQGLTSSIYQHTASCLQRLGRLAPEHKPLLLEQLQAQATRWGFGRAGDI